jgi:FixJ family two-component response regulator
MNATPTVHVIDDDAAVRNSLRFLIESAHLSVQTFESAQEFLDKYNPHAPGCVLLDVRMPGMSGLELHERLIADQCALPVIFITGHGDIQMAVQTLKAGAVDFIEKPFGDADLLDRIHKAIELSESILSRRASESQLSERIARLTGRERQVLSMIAHGNANKLIATQLGVSEKTVEAHRANINRKLSASCVAELVRTAILAEELPPSRPQPSSDRKRRPGSESSNCPDVPAGLAFERFRFRESAV